MTTRRPTESAARPGLRIGELARRSGRSVHAIRWYESIGLVPGVRRDAANHRLYDERHVDWLALMDRLRTTGMSTAEMAEYAALVTRGKASLATQRDLLARHRDRVRSTIAEWRRALLLLDRKVAFYDEWLSTGARPAAPHDTASRPSTAPRRPRKP